VPNLIQVQIQSFQWLIKEGLRELFDEISPIEDFSGGRFELRFGDYEVRVHHTPGHCPGGVCLQVGRSGEDGRLLVVGDTLFAGSIGRTDLPGGDYDTLMRSIREVLLAFPDACTVWSGHGPETTIARETWILDLSYPVV